MLHLGKKRNLSRPIQSYLCLFLDVIVKHQPVDSRFWHCMESLHGQVGFSFITAHSKDLFGRDEASLEDCNLNHEVRVACMICLHVSLMHFSPMVVFLQQAIFAVMTVTPHARLSETVLAKAICQYYHENRLVPIGIGLSAVEQLSAKMAFGLQKVVSRFRRRWKESPQSAKLKGLTTLKQRLKERGITPEPAPSADSQSCSQEMAAERVEQLGNELPALHLWMAETRKVLSNLSIGLLWP